MTTNTSTMRRIMSIGMCMTHITSMPTDRMMRLANPMLIGIAIRRWCISILTTPICITGTGTPTSIETTSHFVFQPGPAIVAGISDEQREAWSGGTVSDWTMEAFELARRDAYGRLPTPSASGVYVLDTGNVAAAVADVRMQLGRAGVRLAVVLNRVLGKGVDLPRRR